MLLKFGSWHHLATLSAGNARGLDGLIFQVVLHVIIHLDHCVEKFAAQYTLYLAAFSDTFIFTELLGYYVSDLVIFSRDAFCDVELGTDAFHVFIIDMVPQKRLCIICKLLLAKST